MSHVVQDKNESWLDETREGESRGPRSLALWMVSIYIGLFLIRPWEELMPSLQPYRLERVYALAMLVVVALTGRRLRWTTQSITVALFAGAVGLSSILAWQPVDAWPALYQYGTVVVTYFVFIAVCRQMADVNWLVATYVMTMFVYLSKSLWEYYVHDRHEFAQSVSRLMGIEQTYGEPNAVAMSAVLSLPLWYYLWCCRDEIANEAGILGSRCFRLPLMIYPAVVLVAVGLTNSRAGMLGLAACGVGTIWYSQRQSRWLPALGTAAVVVIGLWLIAPTEQRERLRTIWNPGAGPANARASALGRWDGFLAALKMVQDRPLTGVGAGNFLPYRVANVDGIPLVAHNLPGQVLGETGWLGGISFLLMIGTTWRNARRLGTPSHLARRGERYRQFAIALQLTLVLSLLFGLSLHNALRYNWIWIAAFGCLAWEFREVEELEEDELYEDRTEWDTAGVATARP
jgi:O-antigen ligase